MIIRARMVVTMDGPPIENGAVAVSGDRIVDVGRFDDIKTRNAGNTLDLGEQVLFARADQRALPPRLHLFARKDPAAEVFHRLDPGD